MKRSSWLAVLLLAAAVPVRAQAPAAPAPPDFPRGKISGYLFGDWYDNLAGDPRHRYDAAGNDSAQANIDGKGPIGRDLNGVQIRRVYFQADNDLSIKYATRFRLEADGRSLASDGKIGVAVKAAYMQVRNAIPRADFFFGVIPTPAFDNIEEFWTLRAVEKTLADFRGLAPSADLGLGLRGAVDPNHVLGYWVVLGDGGGNKPETNRDKRTYLALPVHWKDLRVEPYADYENVAGSRDRATYRLFAGYELRRGVIGGEWVRQVQQRPAGASLEPQAFSGYARWAFTPALGVFARADLWQPDRMTGNRVDQVLFLAGADWQPMKDVHFMPNVESLQHRARGTAVAPATHDLQARVTLYWKFSKPQS